MIELRAGRARAEVRAELGARVTSLRTDGHEFLAYGGRTSVADPWSGGSYPLAPWVGKLRDDHVRSDGSRIRVPRRNDGTVKHGLVRDVPWDVLHADDSTAELVHFVTGSDGWDGECRQLIVLEPTRLRTTLTYTASGPVPVSLGFHPWFAREADGTAPATLFTPGRRIVVDAQGQEVEVTSAAREPRDAVYRADGSTPRLRWRNGRSIEIHSDAAIWVVYERDPLGVCVEPWSHTPGEFIGGSVPPADGNAVELTMDLVWSPEVAGS